MHPETPRRIIKRRGGHGGHHGGAWKVAYADFVTAMMALFIVLWIVGQSQAVKEAVAAYFRDPSGFQKGAAGVLRGGGSVAPNLRESPPRPETTSGSRQADRAALEATATALREQIHHQTDLAKLEDRIKIELVEEGLRVQLVESAQGVFFDVGSAQVKPATRALLTLVGREVGRLPNDVGLEGHTDSRPYAGVPSYSNWELSTDRANAARRILELGGLRPHQVTSVIGYADRHLANPSDPLDARNRRISIIVRFQKTGPAAQDAVETRPPG